MGPFDQAPTPGIYRPDTVSPRNKQLLEELCRPKNWDWQRLRLALIALAALGPGHFIPATHQPETIHIQGFRETIDDLMKRSAEKRAETATVWFADRSRRTLVRSKFIKSGTEKSVRAILDAEPGREHVQQLVVHFHTHPNAEAMYGFSNGDFSNFLGDPGRLLNVLIHADGVLIAAKTTLTPQLPIESIEQRQAATFKDYFVKSGSPNNKAVMDYNHAVCIEFGLALYYAPNKDRDLATRIEVTK